MPGKRIEENLPGYIRTSFKIFGGLAAEGAVRIGKLHHGFGARTDGDGLAEIDLRCRRRFCVNMAVTATAPALLSRFSCVLLRSEFAATRNARITWQQYDELAAVTGFAFSPDDAVEAFHRHLAERQSETGATPLTVRRHYATGYSVQRYDPGLHEVCRCRYP